MDPLVRGRGGGNAGGGTGGGSSSTSLVGSWRHISALPNTVLDTRWTFTATGSCSRTVVTTLLDLGRDETNTRACSYTVAGTTVSIVFQGSSFVSTFSVSFSGGDLLLDGFRFTRFG